LPLLLCLLYVATAVRKDSVGDDESFGDLPDSPVARPPSVAVPVSPARRADVAGLPGRWTVSFVGLAVLGLTPEDSYIEGMLQDLDFYLGIKATARYIHKPGGKKGCLLQLDRENPTRQGHLQQLGIFSRSMADAWIGALTSQNKLVMLAKTAEDDENQKLKVKIGYKMSAASLASKSPMFPVGIGISIIDIGDLDNAVVTKEAPKLELSDHTDKGNWTVHRDLEDYIAQVTQDARQNSPSLAPALAKGAITGLFWIVLHEVIVHDLLDLSHNYSPRTDKDLYDYDTDDAMKQLSLWSRDLGLPERLGHPSILPRDNASCLYLWMDPLHLQSWGWLKVESKNSRMAKYLDLRRQLKEANTQGLQWLQKPEIQNLTSELSRKQELLWVLFQDGNDANKPRGKNLIDKQWLFDNLWTLRTGTEQAEPATPATMPATPSKVTGPATRARPSRVTGPETPARPSRVTGPETPARPPRVAVPVTPATPQQKPRWK